uniref:Metalloprotease n=1 Tax=Rhipicephalus appendiculatus TaxID=34631 RepID=A0A131Z3S2_RHIAP
MEDIVKSPNDTRQYRVITLENGLAALLVSDHKTRPLSPMSCSSSRHSSSSRQSTSSPGTSKKASHGCLAGAEELPDVKIGEGAQVPSLPKLSIASSIANYLSSANCEDVPRSKSLDEGHCEVITELGSGSSSRPQSLEQPFSDGTSEESMSEDDVSVHGGSDSEPESDIESGHHSRADSKQHCNARKEKMAAAALCVGVGSFHEPDHLQGLAHFLEHMVFMGSSKYPRENFFDSFLNKHGGSDNAYTECERTVYKMEVHQKHLYRALDIFANFFVSPLIRKESMERELEAIDNEFQLVLPSDSCRLQQLLGSVAREKHPMRKFMWGNTTSLKKLPEKGGINVHAALRTFFEQHYNPAVMTLAVQSRHSLDELERMVREIFSAIPVREPVPELTSILTCEPFPLEQFGKLYKVQPVKKVNNVSFTWALPSLLHEYRTKPLEYISYVVGHEGIGSILAYLRDRMWALGLVAGNEGTGFHHNTICSLFNITVSLTEEGLKHVKEVLTAVFSFLAMLRKVGPVKSIFEEIQTVADNNFRWCEEESPLDYVERLCANMQLYPPKHYLDGETCLFEYDPALIQKCLDHLVPSKANIMIISCHYQDQGICIKKEPYLETPYCTYEIPVEWLAAWSSLVPDPYFEVPQQNKYIASDFTLKEENEHQSELPVKLHEDQRFRLWYKKDTKFNVPKACVFFQLISPVMYVSAENAVLMDILCDTLLQNMSQETNAAVCASLDFTISVNETGLIIRVVGFNEKLPVLFDVILHHLAAFEVKQQLFENIKKHVQKRYYNLFMKPSHLCTDTRFSILQQCHWSNIEKRKIIKDVTVSSLLCFVEEFRKQLFVEGLVHGNFTASEAIALGELVVKKLNCAPLPTCMIPEYRVMQVPFGNQYCRVASFNIEDHNSMIVNYYQLGPGAIKQHALAELMIDFMEEPCFDILRTKSQLGYDVSCSNRNTNGIVGFTVGVCCSAEKFTCSYVDEQIELFLSMFAKKIAELTQEEFSTQVSSLVKQKSCSDLYLQEESDRYWAEIVSFDYLFDRLQREIEFLNALTLKEFKESCKLFLPSKNPGEPHRRKLSIQIVGYGEAAIAESRPIGYPSPQTPTSSTGDIHNASAEGKTLSYKRCIEHMHNVHPWKHLKRPTDQNSTEEISSEDMAYSLQFLESVVEKQEAVYVNDIIVFKRSLAVFPVCRVTS